MTALCKGRNRIAVLTGLWTGRRPTLNLISMLAVKWTVLRVRSGVDGLLHILVAPETGTQGLR